MKLVSASPHRRQFPPDTSSGHNLPQNSQWIYYIVCQINTVNLPSLLEFQSTVPSSFNLPSQVSIYPSSFNLPSRRVSIYRRDKFQSTVTSSFNLPSRRISLPSRQVSIYRPIVNVIEFQSTVALEFRIVNDTSFNLPSHIIEFQSTVPCH